MAPSNNTESLLGKEEWPRTWACQAALLTINGSFTVYDTFGGNARFINATGKSVIDACALKIASASAQAGLAQQQILGPGLMVTPFNMSINPLVYAVAFATCTAWALFLVSLMSGHKRPWLQRGAALSAAIAMTITSDFMFNELELQYMSGRPYNPTDLRNVRARTSTKVIRLISNTLLWLAQIQLVMRLFPRHRDKIIAKYGGFTLIVLETVFSVLNDFYHPSPFNPDAKTLAAPAIAVIAYFMNIAISVIFSGSVLIYALSPSRFRYAFALPHLMHALLSIVSITSPTVFFCLDIWKSEVEGWGDYIRWIGSVACSVIVWAWVDLIESKLVRDSREGVLGREVFEEEMFQQKRKQLRKFGKRASMQPDAIVFEDRSQTTTSRALAPDKGMRRTWMDRFQRPRTEGIPMSELPTIRHPLASTLSVAPSSTLHDGSSSEEPATDRPRHSIQQEERPASIQGAALVHPGFQREDYWPDEKEMSGRR
ncbi:PalH/RIM21-domain-containing protein [Protomyces lactucae-debilis]|uniref:PalH/RIM21-domain-containing protein n=1 Tax=Protomyces lactucae-debilis TaxID=2754530 RepID=A0A1Y2EZ68_PROLT|nr:PalH/RIM21-domain-containing protein [Protomyces lactucae-debilis]ORY76035.1 PalH/RIM21-domain-containing protein [Protomyces lactucae-debilis]